MHLDRDLLGVFPIVAGTTAGIARADGVGAASWVLGNSRSILTLLVWLKGTRSSFLP